MSTDVVDDDLNDASDDGLEPPTPVVRPGDLDALEAAALAGAGQWVALATWARRDGHDSRSADALKQLATHADDPVAFAWLWSLVTARPGTADWRALQEMPVHVAVPEALLAEVAAEMAAPPSDNATRNAAREAIMARQQSTTPGAIELARAVLAAEADVVPEVGEHAARVLGESRDREARAALLTTAQGSPWPRRAQMLTSLREPLDEGEVEAILAAVGEGRGHLSASVGPNDPHWSRVQRLVATLPAPQRLAVLTQDWLDQPGYAALLIAGPVMRALGAAGAAQIDQLLESAAAGDVPGPVVDALLAQLHTLPEPHAVDLAERAHQLLPPERTAAARQHYVELARVYRNSLLSGRERLALPALAALARMALTEPPAPAGLTESAALEQDEALGDYAEALRPGETSLLEMATMTGGQRRRLGAVLGLRLRGNLPHQDEQNRQRSHAPSPVDAATEDTVAVLRALEAHGEEMPSSSGDAHSAEVLAGLVAIAAGLVAEPLVKAALDAGPVSTAAIARAVPSPTAAILHADPDRWPPSRTLDVLEAITPDAAVVLSVEKLAGALDWTAVEGSADLERAASALARHRRLLATAVRVAVRSQDGPPAKAAPLARVVALVHALVDDGGEALSEPSGYPGREHLQDAAEPITVLVDSSHSRLRQLAGYWLLRSDPTAALIELVIRADHATKTKPSPYLPARTAMAAHLCTRAQDDVQQGEARIEALQAAQRLDPVQARASAMELIESSPAPLRRAAAGVIDATPASAADGDRLSALAAAEDDKITGDLLEQARRRLTSGSLDEALTNLVELVDGQVGYSNLDPAVSLPYTEWHETFLHCVDRARAAAGDTAQNRLDTLIVLADLLADQAIATHWRSSGNPGEATKATQILANATGRPEAGNLANKHQQLRQDLPWIADWASLRRRRGGHPAPMGSTSPRLVDDREVITALSLLTGVVEGWAQTMYAAVGKPMPPVTR